MYRLLIVDDESLTRLYIRQNISKLDEKWEMAGEASDGAEALQFLASNKVDLVITDIRMPVMDGLELCAKMYHKYPGQRTVILSGYDEFSYAQQAIRYGVDDYLLKPVVEEELQAALQKAAANIGKDAGRLKAHVFTEESPLKTSGSSLINGRQLEPSDPAIEQTVVNFALDYINCHYCEPISLVQLAEHAGVTSNYLSSIFHKQVGESYIKYLTRVRMEQAAKLLKAKPPEKISKVSEKIGYVSVKHFLNVFKQHFNCTPGEYRSKTMFR